VTLTFSFNVPYTGVQIAFITLSGVKFAAPAQQQIPEAIVT